MPLGDGEHPILIPRPADARPGRPAPWEGIASVPPLSEIEKRIASFRPALAAGVESDMAHAAVLAPMYAGPEGPALLLIKRSGEVRTHRGEIAFPGGKSESGDPDLWATALRETEEEVGISPKAVRRIGMLDPLVTVGSRFVLTPFVGEIDPDAEIRLSLSEASRAIHVPIARLTEPGVFREEIWIRGDEERPIYFFRLDDDDIIWGATGRILYQLLSLVMVSGS